MYLPVYFIAWLCQHLDFYSNHLPCNMTHASALKMVLTKENHIFNESSPVNSYTPNNVCNTVSARGPTASLCLHVAVGCVCNTVSETLCLHVAQQPRCVCNTVSATLCLQHCVCMWPSSLAVSATACGQML